MERYLHSASNNGLGGVAHADNWAYVMESVARFLNGLSDSDDSDDEVSHVSTESGSVISQFEYEGVVKNFEALENQWLNEPDSLQQENLYKSIFDAEVAFAVKFGIYSHLITGNQKEVSVAKDKTRNRMRTRLKNKCCIGLPVQGRAMKREKLRRLFECV